MPPPARRPGRGPGLRRFKAAYQGVTAPYDTKYAPATISMVGPTFRWQFQYQATTIAPPGAFDGSRETGWYAALREPVRVKPGLPPHQQQFLAYQTEPTQFGTGTGWFTPFSEPVRTKPRLAVTQQQFLAYQTEPTQFGAAGGWFTQLSEPVRLKPGLRVQQQSVTAYQTELTALGIGDVSWFVPLTEPVRRKPVPTRADQTSAPAVETITVDKWFVPFADPVRVPRRTAYFHDSAYDDVLTGPSFPEVIFGDKWYQPWSEPVRRKPAARQVDPPTLVATEIVTADKWFVALGEPIRIPRRTAQFADSAYDDVLTGPSFPEVVTESRWHQPWSEPVRLKPGLGAAQQLQPVQSLVTEIITLDKWICSWSEPVRQKRGTAVYLQSAFTTDVQPLRTPEFRWLVQWTDPRRDAVVNRHRISLMASGPVTDPHQIQVFEDRWHQPWSEPVRFRRGLAKQYQVSWASNFDPIKTVLGVLAAIETGDNSGEFSAIEFTAEFKRVVLAHFVGTVTPQTVGTLAATETGNFGDFSPDDFGPDLARFVLAHFVGTIETHSFASLVGVELFDNAAFASVPFSSPPGGIRVSVVQERPAAKAFESVAERPRGRN